MTEKPKYISHLKQAENGSWLFQSNEEHSEGVAKLAETFAKDFGMDSWGRTLGLLHDKGKEKNDFQNYIMKASGYDENVPPWINKDHAYVGALLAKRVFGIMSEPLINQIAGHHAGMYDYDTINYILNENKIPPEINCDIDKVNLPIDLFRNYNYTDINHLFRMLFSCLVDADYLDTERFMTPEAFEERGNSTTLSELLIKLQHKLDEFKNPTSNINIIRNNIQEECKRKAYNAPGFFSLTVPTGGGKTFASIVWALHHAEKYGKRRVIIAIPYTSIIVQTASILKSIFGEDNVLEHHSNVDFDTIKDSKLRHKIKLATENWDYPIIVTTNVQLFESIYSNKPSACRKLHNICNSVIILDEVQTLPTDFLQPIVDALKTYVKNFGVSVLLTTASQPILSGLIEGCNPNARFKGIENITEIIPESWQLHKRLRRVKLEINNESITYDEIAEKISSHEIVLCIVNTRHDAKEIFDRLPNEGIKLHLSRMMCPIHIRETIEYLKQALKDENNRIVRVVSTQLIEAGVDIDFPVVYRQEAGLDSILQAAGRCNREGKRGVSTAHVFSLSKEHPLPKGSIQQANNARLALGDCHDWFSPVTITKYFEQLYCRTRTFDKQLIHEYLYKPKEMCFQTAAENFHLIEDSSISIIVNWKDSMLLINELKSKGPTYSLMKKLGQYTVNVRDSDFKKIKEMGLLEEVIKGIYIITSNALVST
jgi:CRISPR-associated endonuclease/helicase Cas3